MATNDSIAPNDPASIVAVPNGNQSVTGIFSNQGNYGLQASNVSQTFTLPASLTVTSNFAVNGYNTPQSINSINTGNFINKYKHILAAMKKQDPYIKDVNV